MWKIVGYGPVSRQPSVPDYVLLDDGNEKKCILRGDPRVCSEQPVPGEIAPLDGSVLFFDGMWIAVEEDRVETFVATHEKEWRAERSRRLIAEASSVHGDPVRKLQMMEAAGKLVGVDIPGLVRRLQLSKSSPDEDLAEVFRRVSRQ